MPKKNTERERIPQRNIFDTKYLEPIYLSRTIDSEGEWHSLIPARFFEIEIVKFHPTFGQKTMETAIFINGKRVYLSDYQDKTPYQAWLSREHIINYIQENTYELPYKYLLSDAVQVYPGGVFIYQ